MSSIMLAGLLFWEAGAEEVRIVDGGTLTVDGDVYVSRHAIFGAISAFESINEGVGDEAPAGVLTFSPAPDADPYTLNSPDLQGTRLRMWIAEVDKDTGAVVGTPDQVLDSIVDVPRLRLRRQAMELETDIVSRAERLFLINEGNVLSGEFHRRLYPSETGLDNAIGVPTVVAWGTVGAPRGTASYGGGGGGLGGLYARMAGEGVA
jgi:hypothetical protein